MYHWLFIGAGALAFYYAVLSRTDRTSKLSASKLPDSLDRSQYTQLARVTLPSVVGEKTDMRMPRDDTVLHPPGRSVSFGVPAARLG